ncbi:MAG: helix-turn-helix domain-containing protein [Lachnospiraceae bacterium]
MGVNEYVKIGEKIKRARKASGLTQREMAKKLGLAYSTYSNYENNHREPDLDTINKICAILGIDKDALFYDFLSTDEIEFSKKHSLSLTDGSYHEITVSLLTLNSDGRNKVAEYADDLSQIPKYRISYPENKDKPQKK